MDETDEEEIQPLGLRMRPRLAKIKSVQNMKLLTQSMSPKGFSSRNNTVPEKGDSDVASVKGVRISTRLVTWGTFLTLI